MPHLQFPEHVQTISVRVETRAARCVNGLDSTYVTYPAGATVDEDAR